MKTRKQIAEEVHDELLKKLIELNNLVDCLRLEGKGKQKEKVMIERDYLEKRISLLEKEEGLV